MKSKSAGPIKLRRVQAQNYRTWPTLDWTPPESGVSLVRGRNLSSGSTSDTGKTSLLTSPSYALGIGPPTTETKTWDTEESWVKLDVSVGELEVEVARGTNGLLVRWGGKEWTGRAGEQELRRLVGSPSTLRALVWRRQRSKGNFYSLGAAERREFLAEVLEVKEFEKAAEEARKRGDVLRTETDQQRLRFQLADKELVRLVASIPPIEPSDDLSENLVQLETYRDGLEASLAEDPQPQFDVGQLQTHVRTLDRQVQKARDELSRAERKLEEERSWAKNTCPTCGQPCSRHSDVGLRLGEVSLCRVRLSEAQQELADAESALAFIQAEQEEQRQAWANRTKELRQELQAIRSAIKELLDEVSRRRLLEERRARTLQEIETRKAEVELLVKKIQDFEVQTRAQQDLAAMLRQYVVALFEEVLADLSETTNSILALVPNVSSVSLEFLPKERANRPEVGCEVSINGVVRGGDPISGGQEAAVELAVDFAVDEVVIGRGLVSPGWKVLDEPFDGMGATDKEAFLEYMASKRDRLFLVVDHSKEFAELFIDAGIGVEWSGHSRIVSPEDRATF